MRLNRFAEIYRDIALQVKHDTRPRFGSWDLHTHDYYECFLVTAGRGIQLFSGGEEALMNHHLYFVRPEHGHGFAPDGQGRYPDFMNIVLRFDLVESFRKRHPEAYPKEVWSPGSDRPMAIELAPGQFQEIRQVIGSLVYSSRSAINLEWFLTSLSRLLQPLELELGRSTLPVWLREGLHQFREPETLRQGVKALVRHCGCSPEHLAREMKKHLGKRPVAWLNDQRMRYATLLLQTTELNITEIALEVGVNNLSHFHALFRQKFGETPLRYRHRHLARIAN